MAVKSLRRVAMAGLAALLLAAVLVAQAYWRVWGRTLVEFRISQNLDMILFSDFGEPPQFAIWLEDPVNSRLRTVFVTRRSATGDWEGKAECPGALPRWFEIYRQETGRPGPPTPGAPAPDAVTQATPDAEHIAWAVAVEPGSRWVCWLEVNLAADYNEAFQEYDEETGMMDTDKCGQPSILYRGEIVAEVGTRVTPKPYGQKRLEDAEGEVHRGLGNLTSATEIFKSIEIHIVRPRVTLF